ncbi:hypothetical protein RHGRI_031006 [Rhododendron griersonianum]|uniref:CCHC-type domain-containing protein n=1 Tax=Rhododendron griersonianum TaxID=479676 RepID=A0AAV6I6R4_9ERIC|nr:hypothetical protein RHGRI_031006 [Rhododendron griersonianum]
MDDLKILDLEEGSSETGEVSNLCLVRKVLSPKIINNTAITNVCSTAWKTRSPFSVIPWNNNVFLFRFEEAEDRELVLMERPWSVMNSLLVLRLVETGIAIPDHDFSLKVKSALKKDLWISYKYEKLSDLCFACGRFGHDNRSCRFTPRNEGLNFGYGPEIRGQGVRRSNIPIEVIRHEVDMAEDRVAELVELQSLLSDDRRFRGRGVGRVFHAPWARAWSPPA